LHTRLQCLRPKLQEEKKTQRREEIVLLRLEKKRIKPAALMLTRVFKDDPMTDMFPDPEERRVKTPYVHEFFLRYYLPYGCSFISSPRLEGIAIWRHSNINPGISFWRMLTSGAIWPAMKIGRKALRKMQAFDQYVERKRKKLAPAKHWYLAVLAVDPQYQGKGYGSKLLNEMLSSIDKEGLPCYVETEGEKNVSMYQHFGFQVVDEFTVPNTTDKLVAMLREPKIGKKKTYSE
jgi:ribosomal protein S18 acetylase RimI-like enzyme